MDEARKSFGAQVLAASPTRFVAAVSPRSPAWSGRSRVSARANRSSAGCGDQVVVDVPLRYEAGDMKARVSFDAEEKVAGLFILAAETP